MLVWSSLGKLVKGNRNIFATFNIVIDENDRRMSYK